MSHIPIPGYLVWHIHMRVFLKPLLIAFPSPLLRLGGESIVIDFCFDFVAVFGIGVAVTAPSTAAAGWRCGDGGPSHGSHSRHWFRIRI
ncbi:hypothetical protein I7I51_06544, partial [Histoplasma capsulatum]